MRYLLILFIALMVGCNNEPTGKRVDSSTSDLTIQIVDGCEYVFYRPSMNSGGGAIVHHANCHNQIHKAANQ